MLGMEAVAERMPDDFVGQHTAMPSLGKTAQAVHTARRLENRFHGSIMTIVPSLCKCCTATAIIQVEEGGWGQSDDECDEAVTSIIGAQPVIQFRILFSIHVVR